MTQHLPWIGLICAIGVSTVASAQTQKSIDLPSSKQILAPVPGSSVRLNSLPMASAWSPDGRYLALLNAGYGTFESDYEQSIAVLDTQTGKLKDYPEARTQRSLPQTMYAGLAFSLDGAHLYASFDSLTAPEGDGQKKMGNSIAVFSFRDGVPTAERLIPVAMQKLAAGKIAIGGKMPENFAQPAPTGLAVLKSKDGSEQILVANEFSDNVLLLDTASGRVVFRFDLSNNSVVPAVFPIAVTATKDGRRGFVALWNGSAIVELDLLKGKVVERLPLLPAQRATSASSHPSAFAFSPDEKMLYVAVTNRDAIAAVDISSGKMQVEGLFDTRLPGQSYFGAMPDAVAVSPDGKRVYAANSGSNAIAVFDAQLIRGKSKGLTPSVRALGFIPTEWYPTAVAVRGNQLYVATGKGIGTGPNKPSQKAMGDEKMGDEKTTRRSMYIAALLYGSLATIDRVEAEKNLQSLTRETLVSNRMNASAEHVVFPSGVNPIRHIIYVIKENRTYDQIFGDLKVGDGDPSLAMYGRAVTPNQHRLAEQFGVIDNFYDSGEVSGDGHVWSTAAITSDYTEKTWQQSYRGGQRHYDFEGMNQGASPLAEGIADVNEPASGYLWANLARNHKSLYHFGEYVSTKFCNDSARAASTSSPTEGTPEPVGTACPVSHIRKGERVPENYGGGVSQYPWSIPLIQENKASKPELEGHFDPQYPDFNLAFPDQWRADEVLTKFRGWVATRTGGKDEMPSFILLRLPNDHTAGTNPGGPRPRASIADNDLALGRIVEAVSHSAYWQDTAFFILEDDAQSGADHVDAHRSIALVISKFAPRAKTPTVHHAFYSTVSMIHTMEDLLAIPPMNNNDAFSSLMSPLFQGAGDQPAFDADFSNRDNGMIYEANTRSAPGAKESRRMDFRHADQADTQKLNVVLWRDAMGTRPVPAMLRRPQARSSNGEGDGD